MSAHGSISSLSIPSGATSAEWDFLYTDYWPRADILPVVMDQTIPLAKATTLPQSSVGKAPSIIRDGEVYGVAGWPSANLQARSNGDVIDEWRLHPGVGYGLRTTEIFFIDCDIDDEDRADLVRCALMDHLGPVFPTRTRGSARFAVPIRVPGSLFRKHILKGRAGVVELLCRGCFVVLAGQHRSGARYAWENAGAPIPELSEDAFIDLGNAVADVVGAPHWTPRNARSQQGGAGRKPFDLNAPLIRYIRNSPWKSPGGRADGMHLDIICPFVSEHSTRDEGTTSTTVLSTENGEPFIHCLHAHCADRTQEEFKIELRYYGSPEHSEEVAIIGAQLAPDSRDMERIVFENGVPKLTPEQVFQGFDVQGLSAVGPMPGKGKMDFNSYLRMFLTPMVSGIDSRFDSFSRQLSCRLQKDGKWITKEDAIEAVVHATIATRYSKVSRMEIRDGLKAIEHYRSFDSMHLWADSLEWDGVPRIGTFFGEYVPVVDPALGAAASMYWWLSAAARLTTDSEGEGVKADILVTLKGDQGSRKSTLTKCMVPSGKAVAISASQMYVNDKDITDRIRKSLGKLIVEWEEFAGELKDQRSRGLDKAFITEQKDQFIPKFKEKPIEVVRRFMLLATTNEFSLHDPTGSRRHCLLTMPSNARIDTDRVLADHIQLWAEAVHVYRQNPASQATAALKLEALAESLRAKFAMSGDLKTSAGVDAIIRRLPMGVTKITDILPPGLDAGERADLIDQVSRLARDLGATVAGSGESLELTITRRALDRINKDLL